MLANLSPIGPNSLSGLLSVLGLYVDAWVHRSTPPIVSVYKVALGIHGGATWTKADGAAEDTWPQGTNEQPALTNHKLSRKCEQSQGLSDGVHLNRTWHDSCSRDHSKATGAVLAMETVISRQRKQSGERNSGISSHSNNQSQHVAPEWKRQNGSSFRWWRLTCQVQLHWGPASASFLWEGPWINSFLTCPSSRISVPCNLKVLITMEST